MAGPDPAELIEAYFERGWTDGLPVVPPSEKSVRATLDAARLRALPHALLCMDCKRREERAR